METDTRLSDRDHMDRSWQPRPRAGVRFRLAGHAHTRARPAPDPDHALCEQARPAGAGEVDAAAGLIGGPGLERSDTARLLEYCRLLADPDTEVLSNACLRLPVDLAAA